MSRLRRILFLQGNRCFFCDRAITPGEESVEHLVPVSDGGTNKDDNLVACCQTLNQIFGGISVKEKFRALLKHNGKFACPQEALEKVHPPAAAPPHGRAGKLEATLGLVWPDGPAA